MKSIQWAAGLLVPAVLFLIGAGSLVTTTGSGLSIPDWPLAFSRLIPPHWYGGVAIEYTHRVIAGCVILLILWINLQAFRNPIPRSVKRAAIGLMLLVLLQAGLGGLTVLFDLPTVVSVSHAALAQATFLLAVFFLFQVRRDDCVVPDEDRLHFLRPLYPWFALMTALFYLQILFGAWMRHTASGLAVPDFPLAYGHLWPPASYFQIRYLAPKIWIHMIHRLNGFILFLSIVPLAVIFRKRYANYPQYRRYATLLLVLIPLQIVLGGWIIWSTRHWFPTTLHVMMGAIITGLLLWSTLHLRCVEAGPLFSGRRDAGTS